jgi:septal ring factor EnvC (AmiA/AmiB activator)
MPVTRSQIAEREVEPQEEKNSLPEAKTDYTLDKLVCGCITYLLQNKRVCGDYCLEHAIKRRLDLMDSQAKKAQKLQAKIALPEAEIQPKKLLTEKEITELKAQMRKFHDSNRKLRIKVRVLRKELASGSNKTYRIWAHGGQKKTKKNKPPASQNPLVI